MNMTKQSDTQAVSTEVERVAAELNTESILNAGETILTSNISQNADYAAQVKLDREQVRSKNRESLQAIIDNETLSETENRVPLMRWQSLHKMHRWKPMQRCF